MQVEIAPATPDTLRQFYGVDTPFTVRGFVAMAGDRVMGVGGISYVAGHQMAFSDFHPDLGRKDRARCFRHLERFFAERPGTLLAMCSGPSSKRLLERLGFTGDVPMMTRPRA